MTEVPSAMNFGELKRLALNLLPRNSILRSLILSEPDSVPKQEGLVKLTIYVKLLHQEISAHQR